MKAIVSKESTWICRDHRLPIGKRTLVMGVVNVTPDSFSDGGLYLDTDKAVEHALRLVNEGADIIDIGGESTRPGSDPVSASQEMDRVLPVIEQVIKELSVPISIDTTKAGVAEEALRMGAHIINDISGLRFEPSISCVATKYNAGIVLMHIRENPKTMQYDTFYHDLFADIAAYLSEGIMMATTAGIPREAIAVDPGIGFGKSALDNYRLIDRLDKFKELDCPIIVGPSRKSFIGAVLNLPADQRQWGTAAAVACAVLNGANIVRVHDVAEMVQVIRVCDTFVHSRNGDGS